MSRRQTLLVATVFAITFVGGVVIGQTERFELEGNLKFFGVGNGIIFADGSKQTTAGVGGVNDLICTDCVDATDIALGAVGSAEVADNSLTSSDLATDSVGASEIGAAAVGTSEVADNSLTAADLAPDSVANAEIAANAVTADKIEVDAVGTSEVINKSLTLSDLNMKVFMNYTLDIFGAMANGACSNFSGQATPGVAAGSFALVFGARPVSGVANPGWVIEGEDTPTGATDVVKVRVCNFTGASADPPNLRFNFWTIAQ